jgi:phosphopantothenoylcysteine decarboxylase/phosphopantothenate--cysteine ligase
VDSAAQVIRFTTGADLAERLAGCPVEEVDAVFHAAAVSDFRFGEVREREPDGGWRVVSSRKYSTRHGSLWVELLPTPKILSRLRDWFPRAILVGWKFEVEGDWVQAIERGAQQIRDSRTDVCVVNGSAYGQGYYCMQRSGPGLHCADPVALFVQLARMCDTRT